MRPFNDSVIVALRRAGWTFTTLVAIGCGSSGSGDSCATALCVTAGETANEPTGTSTPTGPGDPMDPTATGEPTGGGPPTCADCGADQVCISGACTDVPQMCPCPVETYCDLGAGKCVIGCTKDAECDEGRICDVGARTCFVGCREDVECKTPGDVCAEMTCRPGCNTDANCPLEQLCDTQVKACEAGCKTVENCAPGKVCEGGLCQLDCVDDAGCGAGEICKANVCVVGCAGDAKCGQGEICLNEKCVEGCNADSECDVGEICLGNQCTAGCGPPGGAKADARNDRCPVGKACTGVGCQGDANCDEFICSDACEDGCHSTANEQYECYSSLNFNTSYCMQKCDTSTDCPQGMTCAYHVEMLNEPYIRLCHSMCGSFEDCTMMKSPEIPNGFTICDCHFGVCTNYPDDEQLACAYIEPEMD